jgi:beta-lactamase regulating signal transducer with metallopeptidase domain
MIMFDPLTVSAIALKTSLLVVAVGLIALLMARHSAAWRHLLWTSALALSLLIPLAVVFLPSYVQVPLPWDAAEPWARDEPAPVTTGARHADAEPDALSQRGNNLPNWERQKRSAWPTAMIVWLIGALGVLLRNALAHVGLIRWVHKARPDLSQAWAATLSRVTSDAGLRGSLRVLESDHATSPCTWGFMRPVVLLPAAGGDWPESQRRFALLHELAHIRRWDYLTTQISSMACALHWYNPFVWFAATQASKLQEQACDDVVLRAGERPSDYARFLVSIADSSRRVLFAPPAAVGMLQRSQLHSRVTAILDVSSARLPPSRLALLVVIAPLSCLMLFLATVSAAPLSGAMEAGIPSMASFSSIELRNGGKVNLIHGQSQRVTVLKGDPEQTGITIRDDGRLVIHRCKKRCSRGHELEVEIVTPGLTAIAVAAGGTIESRGRFPPQPGISVAVSHGGTIDMRSMAVASVTASVESGGRIFTKPGTSLFATVEQGGIITYWGDVVVQSSVRHRGVVVKGIAADADKLLAELDPKLRSPLPPVPPVPAVQPISAVVPPAQIAETSSFQGD